MCKFKVGDLVVGRPSANHYLLTVYGYRGIVTNIRTGHGRDIQLDHCYWVNSKRFDLASKCKEKQVGTIREKIRSVLLSKDDRLLRKHDIVSENGNLTDVGRRVLSDILFEDDKVRAEVVKRVQSVDEEEKADCKK